MCMEDYMKRTNIELDEKLLEEGKKATGIKTSKALIDFALKELIRKHRQKRILKLKGKIDWNGNLDEMRTLRGI
jgi:Arc/MetJ family transcription regulator